MRGEVRRRELDAREVAVMPHAELGEPHRAERGLGGLDAHERFRRHFDSGREPRRETRRRRKVRGAKSGEPRETPDRFLAEPDLGERAEHASLVRGARPGTMAIEIVPIGAVEERPTLGDVETLECAEESVLAEVAAVAAIRAVAVVIELARSRSWRAGSRARGRRGEPAPPGTAGRSARPRGRRGLSRGPAPASRPRADSSSPRPPRTRRRSQAANAAVPEGAAATRDRNRPKNPRPHRYRASTPARRRVYRPIT